MKKVIAVLLISGSALGLAFADVTADKEHEALRELNQNVTASLNNVDFNAFQQYLTEPFDLVFADQKSITSIQQLKDYYAEMTSEAGGGMESIKFEPTADALTRFIGANTGITRGTSVDTFTRKDGRKVVINSRWTATVVKDAGKWKITALHAGVNLLDNAYFKLVTGKMKTMMYGAAALAFLIGLGLGFVVGRRRR